MFVRNKFFITIFFNFKPLLPAKYESSVNNIDFSIEKVTLSESGDMHRSSAVHTWYISVGFDARGQQ